MICENCFGDKFLSEHIQRRGTDTVVRCQYCGSINAKAISPIQLTDIVSPVLGLYVESDLQESKPVLQYLKRDWDLFKKLDEAKGTQILEAIFPNENISTKKFKSKQSQNSRLGLWNDFQNELKHKNRFFPQTKIIDLEDLKDLFEFLILKNPPHSYFRARINEGNGGFPSTDMGKPPEKLAKAGRANPVGISYLYTASDIDTAIAEVRPNVGDQISIAKFSVSSQLTLLDLRSPRETVSPFSIDSENLLKLLNELEFLCRLGYQLSQAILPKEADLEYLASQYLCEMIKHFNYNGVVYKSSVGPGFNIALFDDSMFQISNEIQNYQVKSINYNTESL